MKPAAATSRHRSPFLRIVAMAVIGAASQPARAAEPPADAQPAVSVEEMSLLYDLGRQLFDDYAPDVIKEQYDFISREDWNALVMQFQKKLESGSLEEIASLEPRAKRALESIRDQPGLSDYADWLAERLELIRSARDAVAPPPVLAPAPAAPGPFALPPVAPRPQPFFQTPPTHDAIPYYALCHKRVSNRRKPPNADTLAPLLKTIFAAESVPVELVWVAEVESSFNPLAKSPAGARGLFQLMPATARALGLRTFPIDERVHAAKNTRAAARLLGMLHKRFGSWPLALAAYNAGEGRVAAAIRKTPGAKAYADIAAKLPSETRLYVPQVLATLVIREGVPLEKFVRATAPIPKISLPPVKSGK